MLDYEALLADVLGLLYNCATQGKVDNIRFIMDVWSRRWLHLACANGHAGWTYVHKAKQHNNKLTTMETTTTRRGGKRRRRRWAQPTKAPLTLQL
jgi:hypothetical protein